MLKNLGPLELELVNLMHDKWWLLLKVQYYPPSSRVLGVKHPRAATPLLNYIARHAQSTRRTKLSSAALNHFLRETSWRCICKAKFASARQPPRSSLTFDLHKKPRRRYSATLSTRRMDRTCLKLRRPGVALHGGSQEMEVLEKRVGSKEGRLNAPETEFTSSLRARKPDTS